MRRGPGLCQVQEEDSSWIQLTWPSHLTARRLPSKVISIYPYYIDYLIFYDLGFWHCSDLVSLILEALGLLVHCFENIKHMTRKF